MATKDHSARSPLHNPLFRYLRKLVPSVAAASRSKLAAVPLNAIDYLLSLPYPEFRNLPPNHLRVRVGSNRRILFNQHFHMTVAYPFWLQMALQHSISPDSSLLDIGCGCGRSADILRDTYYYGEPIYKGIYTGIDVDKEAIEWCKGHFPSDRFRFHAIDMFSSVYNPQGGVQYRDLPVDDESIDFAFCLSLLTHLLEEDLDYYFRQIYRVLRRGGSAHMSFFCIDHLRENLGGVFTFTHKIKHAYVESLKYPEAAVAYEEGFILERLKEINAKDVNVYAADPITKRGMLQSIVTFQK